VQSRGIYHFPASFRTLTHDDGQCSSLGNCSTNWGAKDSAAAISADRNAEFCLGQFIWTGFDYIGEPTPYFSKNSYFGQIDTAGFEKDSFYAYQAEWTSKDISPMVHILPYWDFNKNQPIDIRVYSNCAKTELFFNGKSYGTFIHNHINGNEISGKWQIPYQTGTLKAVGYDEKGHYAAEDTQSSFSDPVKIEMKIDNIEDFKQDEYFRKNSNNLREFPDFSNAEEACLLFISISTLDKDGNFVANARNRIKVSVRGGRLLGLDNGDSTDYEQYKASERFLFSGRLTAIVEADDILHTPLTIEASSAGLCGAKLVYDNSSFDVEQTAAASTDGSFIPTRKIQLVADGSLDLSPHNKSVKIEAEIFPKEASRQQLLWQAVRLEGIESKCVQIEQLDNMHVIVHAKNDGSFRLRCSCKNGTDLPQIISEYEMSVSGIGTSSLDAYNFISGCEASLSLNKKVLSFQGGVFSEEHNWIGFEDVDFGKDGSDEITIPVFAFVDELTINLWDGTPDSKEGRLIESLSYKAKSIYNHYQPNTWKLSRRLFGIHTICLETKDKLSIKGFVFTKSSKAFSILSSLDASSITGDNFTKTDNAILNIGNNVVFEYSDMNFGTKGCNHIKLLGKAPSGANTIQLRFSPQDNLKKQESIIILEIPESTDYQFFDFDFQNITGLQTVSFIFLPGCNFDFKNFIFS